MINKSAEKRERQNAVRRMRNRAAKSTMRKAIKKFDAAVVAGDKEDASVALDLSLKLLDVELFSRSPSEVIAAFVL